MEPIKFTLPATFNLRNGGKFTPHDFIPFLYVGVFGILENESGMRNWHIEYLPVGGIEIISSRENKRGRKSLTKKLKEEVQ